MRMRTILGSSLSAPPGILRAKRALLPPAGLVLATMLVSCGVSQGAADDKPSVVVGSYPLEEAVLKVGGERVSVVNLTPPGVEPHDLELTARDLQALGEADLIVLLGGGFQPSLEDALDAIATDRVLDVLPAASPLLPGPEGDLSADPHVWLDPARYASIVMAVAGGLSRVDPAGSATYASSAEGFVSELRKLDGEMRDGLAECRSRLLVTGHQAFAYLAAAYGLEQVGIGGVTPDVEPGPERLAEIRRLVTDEHVTTIFAETQLPRDTVDLLASEAGVSVAVLDPLETLSAEARSAGEGYVSVMRRNLEALREGLGCG